MKKLLSLLVVFCITGAIMCPLFANAEGTEKNYITVKVSINEKDFKNNLWQIAGRYSDTKEPITLSTYYDGYLCATIPVRNAERDIEPFFPDEIQFTDKDDSSYEFYNLSWLSRTGVIVGNEKGEARPFDNVTRAEMATMITRFFDIENEDEHELKFEDVNENDWFYPYVRALNKTGIITGESETKFNPQRFVTREEMTVMVARALTFADLRCPAPTVENVRDKDKISDWAKEAYEIIGTGYASDYDDSDFENPFRIINPQKASTRFDVASTLRNVCQLSQLYASDVAIQYGFDKEMPIIDGSTSTYPFTQAVYTNLFHASTTHKSFPNSHSKSHTSYKRLIDGEVDMLFASVYPASDILEYAKEKDVELELIPIAYDAMIFFTNIDNPAENLTKEQITDIYVNNAYSNWSQIGGSDALLYPYCRNNDSGSHAQMEKHFLFGNEIHPEVQKETSMTMSNVLTDVMGAKTDEPLGYGLGYSIYYYFHNMDMFYDTKTTLKLLAIDGVAPTDETIADGSYPLSNNTYVVLRKDSPEGSPERKMAEFMLSEIGQLCVEQAGYGKLKK